MGSPFPSNANGAGNVPLATLSAKPGFPRDSGSPFRQHVLRPCLLNFPCFRCLSRLCSWRSLPAVLRHIRGTGQVRANGRAVPGSVGGGDTSRVHRHRLHRRIAFQLGEQHVLQAGAEDPLRGWPFEAQLTSCLPQRMLQPPTLRKTAAVVASFMDRCVKGPTR
jgi:hypothetical protein